MARPYTVALDSGDGVLQDRVAVVTGASGAIGRAISLRLALEGATVYILGRDRERLTAIAHEARALNATCLPVELDLANTIQVEVFFAELNRIDILVNCAGGSSRSASQFLWNQSAQIVEQVIRVNLLAAITCTRGAAKRMVGQGSGSIISVGSIVGAHGKSRFSEYAGAKAGLSGYMKSAALELGPYGIRVNLVSPGIVPRGTPSASDLDRIRASNVLGEVCREEDVADAVLYFASDRSLFVTGQELTVDGGRSLGLRGDV